MNLRIASDSVRIRVSFEEAQTLLEKGNIEELLTLPPCEDPQASTRQFHVALSVTDFQDTSLQLFSTPQGITGRVQRSELVTLLSASSTRDTALTVQWSEQGRRGVFEIDAFSRRKAGEKA